MSGPKNNSNKYIHQSKINPNQKDELQFTITAINHYKTKNLKMDEQQTRKQIPKSTASGPQFFLFIKQRLRLQLKGRVCASHMQGPRLNP